MPDTNPACRTAFRSISESVRHPSGTLSGTTPEHCPPSVRNPVRHGPDYAVNGAKPRVVHDHGSEFVNRDVAAVIKTHNLIDIKTKARHPESNGIVERFNGTVRDESDNDYGSNYLQAEAIIEEDPCWCLRYGSPLRPLDEVGDELNLREGMPVLLYYEDPSEEFEVSAVLVRRDTLGPRWHACADWATIRRIR